MLLFIVLKFARFKWKTKELTGGSRFPGIHSLKLKHFTPKSPAALPVYLFQLLAVSGNVPSSINEEIALGITKSRPNIVD